MNIKKGIPVIRYIFQILIIAVLYYVISKLVLSHTILSANLGAIWIPSGLVLAGVLAWDWPIGIGIFIGSFLINLEILNRPGMMPVAAVVAAGCTLQALSGAWLIRKFIKVLPPNTAQSIFLAVGIVLLTTLVAPIIAIASLYFTKHALWNNYSSLLLTGWLDGVSSSLLFTPLLLILSLRWEKQTRAEKEIKRFSSVIAQMADIVVITDVNGVIEYVNPAFEQLTGYSQIEAIGKTPSISKSGLENQDFYKRLWDTILRGEVFQDEIINRKKNGEIYYETKTITPIRSTDGTITHFVATGKDITERKKAEDALHESEERFQSLFESSNVVTLIIEPDSGKIMDANSAAVKFYGYSLAQIKALNIADINQLPPDEVTAERLKAKKEQRSYFIFPHRIADGQIRTVEVRSHPIKTKDGILLFSIIYDITERRQVEDALNESKILFNLLMESIPQNIYAKDTEGRFIFANQQYCETQGKTLEEIVGKTDFDLHPSELAEKYRQDDRMVIETGSPIEVEEEHAPKNQKKFFVQVIKTPLHDSKDQTVGTLGIFWDITKRKLSEELLNQQSEQLRILYETSQRLNRTLNLDEIYQVICDFMSSMASNDGLVISAFNQETKLITCRAYWIDNQWLDVSEFPPIPLEEEGKGTQSVVIRTGQALLINDYQARMNSTQNIYTVDSTTNEVSKEIPPDEEVTRSALIVPLKDGDRVNGVIQVMSYRLNAYTESQLRLLEALAVHIAHAEKNAILYSQVQEELRERTQAEIELTRSKQQLEATLNALPDLMFELDEGHHILDFRAPNQKQLYTSPDHFIGKTIYDIMPQEATEIIDHALTEALQTGRHFGSIYSLLMPDGMNWFELSISRKNETGKSQPHFIVLVHDITERKHAAVLQETVYRIAEAARTAESLQDLYPRIHQKIATIMQADNFYIALYDTDSDMLRFVYSVDEEDKMETKPFQPNHGLTAHVLQTGKSLLFLPEQSDLDVQVLGTLPEVWLGVPLMAHNKTIGVMAIQHYSDARAYTEREQRVLEFVSSQVATAITRKQTEEAVQLIEKRNRALIENAPDGIALIDAAGRFKFGSPSAFRMFGYDSQEIIGRQALKLMHPDDATQLQSEFLSLLKNPSKMFKSEYRFIHRDGTYRWLEGTFNNLIDEPSVNAVINNFRDITERKAAELARRQQRKLLEYHYQLVEILTSISTRFINLPSTEINSEINHSLKLLGEFEEVDRSYVFSLDRNLFEMNNTHEWCAPGINPQIENSQKLPMNLFPWWMEKLERQEEVYIPLVSQLPPEAQSEREILEAQSIQSVLVIPLIANNILVGFLGFDSVVKQQIWSQDSILLIKMAGDIISNALMRKETEETVRLIEKRNSALIENAPDGIVLLDDKGRFKFSSTSAHHIFGYTSQEIIGTDSLEKIHPEDLPQLLEAINKSIANPTEVFSLEYRFLHKNGTYRWVESTYSNLFAEPGVNAMVVNFRDNTERKLVGEMLQKSQSGLEMAQSIAHLGSWELDIETGTGSWSKEMFQLFHRTPKLGVPPLSEFMEMVHPEDRQMLLNAQQQAIETGKRVTAEYRIDILQNKTHFFETRLQSFMNTKGKVIMSGTVLDITERRQSETALRESDERFRQLAENIQEVFWIYDIAGQKMGYVSPAFESIWSRTCQSLYKNPHLFLESVLLEDQPIMLAALEKQARGESTEVDYRIQRPDGSIRWIWDRGFPIFDEAGKLVRTAGVATDVTELKSAQRELEALNRDLEKRVEERTAEVRQNEATYRALFENSNDGIFLFSPEGEALQANQQGLKMIDSTLEEWQGTQKNELVLESQRVDSDANFEAAIRGERVPLYERTLVSNSGKKAEVEVNLSAIHDASGKVILMQSVVRDITERKKSEDTLRESEERYRRAISAADAVPYSLDYEKNIYTFMGEGIERITGYSHDELTPQLFDSFIQETKMHGDLSTFSTHESTRLVRSGQAPKAALWRSDFRIINKTGENRWLSDSSVQVLDENEHITGSIGILQDITEQKEAEEALRDSRDKLSTANAALEKASRLKDEFLASMSHELRTPLTGILGLSEALQLQTYGPLSEKQIKALKNIEISGRHLLDLINDILDLSKIEAGKLDMQLEPCSVADICQASMQLVKGMAHQKKQNINFSINPPSISLLVDSRRLKQMLVNLLSNAVKFTPEGGSLGLKVQVNNADKTILFNVWDKGIGISPEELKKLFKPFVQLDSSLARQYSGTGLGLSLVQRMAELHGGSIKVESTPGEGSQFIIILPWAEETHQPVRSLKEENIGKVKNTFTIEDNVLDAEQVTRYLKEIGITNIVQPKLIGALETIEDLSPDVILLDLNFPEGSGLNFLNQLKSKVRLRDIPVIITSVEERRSEAMKLGAIGYLVKPFTRQDLQSELAKAADFIHSIDSVMVITSAATAPLVLIADDNETVIQFVTDYLEAKGYRVIATRNGYELLNRAPELHPDIILVDIQMPGIDGMETMRRLRLHNDPLISSTPIIAVTALAMTGDRESCLQAGANEYMSKPIVLSQLVRSMNLLLKEKADKNSPQRNHEI